MNIRKPTIFRPISDNVKKSKSAKYKDVTGFVFTNLCFVRPVILFTLMLITGGMISAQRVLPCPAVDIKSGAMPPLVVPEVKPSTAEGDYNVDQSSGEKAFQVVNRFETGGIDPWGNVNSTDTISMGAMQWNWGSAKTLVNNFLVKTSREKIALASSSLRNDLTILKDLSESSTPEKKTAADKVIFSWTHNLPNDPVIKGIRKSVRTDLSAWLNKPEIRAVQLDLIKDQMGKAFHLARAWLRDSGSQKTLGARLATYFYDMQIFNGSNKQIWVPQVKEYRSRFENRTDALNSVFDWLNSCGSFSSPNTKQKKVYSAAETISTASHWKKKFAQDPTVYDDDQIDLMIFGLLVAQRSAGTNATDLHGVFQGQVLFRRGKIILGWPDPLFDFEN